MPNIAVIVPVYKAEASLRRCVDSILSQTYPNICLVLVDDGSPDRCPEICDGYAAADSRVHVIHQRNSGPSAARNHGIDWVMKHTDCSYLAFIDSDDCVHPAFLQRLYEAVQTTGAKAAMCTHRYIGPRDSLEIAENEASCSAQVMSAEDLMIHQAASFNYPWGKLFPRSSFLELRYPVDVSFGEDNLIIFKALFGCEQVVYLDEKLYFYFYNAEGITKSPWSERSLQVFLGIEAQMEYYKANGYNRAYRKATELYIQQCAYQIHRIRENKADLEKNRRHLNDLKDRMRTMLRGSGYSLRENFFWYEALHPQTAKVQIMMNRIRRNLNENGLAVTLRKLAGRIKKQGSNQ